MYLEKRQQGDCRHKNYPGRIQSTTQSVDQGITIMACWNLNQEDMKQLRRKNLPPGPIQRQNHYKGKPTPSANTYFELKLNLNALCPNPGIV